MNASTKRCLLVSAGAHALLLVTFVVGSAFRPKEPTPTVTSNLKMIPSLLVENALAGGGGNPKLAQSEDKQKGDTLQPLPPPPPPERKVVKVEPKKEVIEKPPVKEVVKESVKPPEKKLADKEPAPVPKPKAEAKPVEVKPKNKITLDDLRKPDRSKAQAEEARKRAEAEAKAAEAREYEQRVANAVSSLRSGFTQGTKIEVSGSGGAAYADYASIVKAIYDDAWIVTDNVPDDNSTAMVRVRIARDGDVIEAAITKRSGNGPLDHTVEMAIRKVKFVRPFPAGSHDSQRTFFINFNLKGKRSIG